MSALLVMNVVCGPGCGFSWIALAGIVGVGFGELVVSVTILPAIVWKHYDILVLRIGGIGRLVVLVDIAHAFDIAALSAFGLQVEDDRCHVVGSDALDQRGLRQIE